jgi:hypothetical protein
MPLSGADLRAAWEAAANPQLAALTAEPDKPGIVVVPEQWLVLVACRDEEQQVEVLEGLRKSKPTSAPRLSRVRLVAGKDRTSLGGRFQPVQPQFACE